jgi:hypothetical protein
MGRCLTLLLTNRCALQCAHCGPRSGPFERGVMTTDVIARSLAAARLEGCALVNLSGGEPFVLGAALTEIVAQARGAGFTVRISSGAYWSSSIAQARRRLEPLAAAGLAQLYLSHSTEHAAFVPLANIVFAAQAARELGLEVAIILAMGRHSTVRRSSVEAEFARHAQPVPFIAVTRLIPAGRADAAPADALLLQPVDALDGPCPSLTEHPTVFEDGTLAGCASVTNRHCPDLQFGSVLDGAPETAFRAMHDAPLSAWIHRLGVVSLKTLIEHNSAIRFQDRYVNICHLCTDILTNPEARQVLAGLGVVKVDGEKSEALCN